MHCLVQIRRPSLQGELPPTADATRQPDAALTATATATATAATTTTTTTTRRTGISSSLPIRQPSGPFVVEQRRRSGRGRLSMSGGFRPVAHSKRPRPAHRRRSVYLKKKIIIIIFINNSIEILLRFQFHRKRSESSRTTVKFRPSSDLTTKEVNCRSTASSAEV